MSNEVKTYTLEEVNAYRAEVYRILISWGEYKEDAKSICGYNGFAKDTDTGIEMYEPTIEQQISYWSNVMWQSPKDYAELMCM